MSAIVTVSQLNAHIKNLLKQDEQLAQVYVRGELSNCKLHTSGHMYFTLKDSACAMRGVMFRSAAARLKFRPQDGMKLLVSGHVDVYERDGQYQLYAEYMAADGVGALALAYEQRKRALQQEGLFDERRKQPIPPYPRVIGLVTAPTGAAVRDIVSILRRRCPSTAVQLYPVLVQGAQAPQQIAQALDCFSGSQVDTVIVGRGGGSMEDLWAFNEEIVVRAVARCKKPVISAVGHETDVTLCDFAADLRAPTPSAAAELAVPDVRVVRQQLDAKRQAMQKAMQGILQQQEERMRHMRQRLFLAGPQRTVQERQQQLAQLSEQLGNAMQHIIEEKQRVLQRHMSQLDVLSPLSVLERGYAVLQDAQGHNIVHVRQVQPGQMIAAQLAQGRIWAKVERMEEKQHVQESDL